MNIKFAPVFEKIQSSFWFIPSLMMIFSLLLAAGTIYIDVIHKQDIQGFLAFLYTTDVSAVRSLLGTIAGAMITVTSIAFSITIVSLTLASSQFGPRLMRNFMMDKGTQFVLGSFIATFLFCIAIFCAISFKAPYAFQPGVTIAVAIAMTCFSVWILIYFIHHVAQSIQADVVIDGVYCELQETIGKLFPETSNENLTREGALEFEKNRGTQQFEVSVPASGYLQLIDKESLLTLASKLHCTIQLHYSPGDFIVENSTIATVYGTDKVKQDISESIIKHIVFGACRTPVQDPEFAVHQLVEIALRALSPGINDPYTAITCIDKLTSVLCSLARKTFPYTNIFIDGVPRLVCKPLTFTDIADAAFDQIRQECETNLAVTIQMLDSLHVLETQAKTAEHHSFVQAQTRMIEQQQAKQSLSDEDNTELLRRINKIIHNTKLV